MGHQIAALITATVLVAVPAYTLAGDLFGGHKTAPPLTADEAFRPLPPERRGDNLKLEWDIAPGYFLYRSRVSVEVVAPPGARLGALALPKGEPHHDTHFGDDEIYRNDLTATAAGASTITRIRIHYQGCADAGLCYPPQEKELDVANDASS